MRIIEGFMGDEEFAPDVIRDLEPVEALRMGVIWSNKRVRVKRRWNVEGIHGGE